MTTPTKSGVEKTTYELDVRESRSDLNESRSEETEVPKVKIGPFYINPENKIHRR